MTKLHRKITVFNKCLSYLFGVYFFASSAVFAAIATIVCLLTARREPARQTLHRVARVWGFHYLQMIPGWNCKFEGVQNIANQGACVLVANHQSYWDILALYGLPTYFKWVSKEEVLKIPFIGWNLKLNECVCFGRSELKSIKKMLSDCKKWLQQGTSIMIFPEGTRTETGELQEFKDGPFRLAVDCNVPVVPIVVHGTFSIFPKKAQSLNFNSPITVKILPALNPADFQNAKQLRDAAFQQIQETLQAVRSSSPKPAAVASTSL